MNRVGPLDELTSLINQWNENRLDLFRISTPNEFLEFYGVMRFYYQEKGQKVTTKCIRVSGSATTQSVIDALVEKFHPDLKMLTEPNLSIWEVHENGAERMLGPDEHPLLVQLGWNQHNKEGRFLLKSADELLHRLPPPTPLHFGSQGVPSNRTRNTKKSSPNPSKSSLCLDQMSKCLYEELPDNTFTRTISNPEVVMKRQREQKFEQKLMEIGSSGFSGGTLKVYGEELDARRPYVSILVSPCDTAQKVIAESVEKYGHGQLDPRNFDLVEVKHAVGSSQSMERVMGLAESPVVLLARNRGKHGEQAVSRRATVSAEISFALRRKRLPEAHVSGMENVAMLESTKQVTCFDALSDNIVSIQSQATLPHCQIILRQSVTTFISRAFEQSKRTESDFPLGISFIVYELCQSSPFAQRYPILSTFCEQVKVAVHSNPQDWRAQVFWLANVSELYFMVNSSLDCSDALHLIYATLVQCFSFLIDSCIVNVEHQMIRFLDVNTPNENDAWGLLDFLELLSAHCKRVHLNAGFIIQVFSHVFYTINMYAFNWLIATRDGNASINCQFALKFRDRLRELRKWSEFQGLELVAECQLDRISQTLHLLLTPKSVDQIASLGATCYKLNSLQVRFLLERFLPTPTESPPTQTLIDNVVQLAQSHADRIAMEEKESVTLREDPRLDLPLTIPNEGFFTQGVDGLPSQLLDLLSELERQGLCDVVYNRPQRVLCPPADVASCRMSIASTTTSCPKRTQLVTLRRDLSSGLGLSIVAAQGRGDRDMGIYIKKVVENSVAAREGSLSEGDQLLRVNGFSLTNISQEIAAKQIASAGAVVYFEVLKHAAYYNGLASWLGSGAVPMSASTPVPLRVPVKNVVMPPVPSMPRFQKLDKPRPLLVKPGNSDQLDMQNAGRDDLITKFSRRGSVGSLGNSQVVYAESGRRSAPLFNSGRESALVETDRRGAASHLPLTNGTCRLIGRTPTNNPGDVDAVANHDACLSELNRELEKRSSRDSNLSKTQKLYPNCTKNDDFARQVDLLQEQANTPIFDHGLRILPRHPSESNLEESENVSDNWGDLRVMPNCDEPQSQVLGLSEIYNDPRQRRLNKLHEMQPKPNENVDAAQLNFRDKMRLFTTQLGEDSPRFKFKSSSAQREIEDNLDA